MKLTSNLTDPFYSSDFPLYSNTCVKIDSVLREMKLQTISQESLGGNVFGRMIVGVADTFLGLLNTFKTNLLKFNKHLKRSEIKEFVESNRTKTWTVTRQLNYLDDTFEVYSPAGMKVKYLTAINTLKLIYNQLNALDTAKTLNVSLSEIFNDVSSGNGKASGAIGSASSFITTIVKGSKSAVLQCQNEFNSSRADTVAWKEVYSSIEDIGKTVQELLGMEFRLQDVNQLTELIKQMENTLRGIVDVVKSADDGIKVLSRDIIILGETAKNVALIFDSYGLAVTRQMSLEHNTVLNINLIYKSMVDKTRIR